MYKLDIVKILEKLDTDGIAVVDGLLDSDVLKNVKAESEQILAKATSDYNYGKGTQITLPSSGIIKDIFTYKWMQEIADKYLKRSRPLNPQVAITHEYISTDDVARNGFWHFDRRHSLKFFFYLTDVTEGCGAFSIDRGKHKLGKKLRTDAWKETGTYANVRNRILVDYDNLTIDNPEEVLGSAGTLLIFDSDLFHRGGILDEGKERMIIRGHTWS